MGLCQSKLDDIEGSIIIDSIVVSNSKIYINDNVIDIPLKSLESHESSVISINRKDGSIKIAKGPFHGTLAYNSVLEEIKKREALSPKSASL